MSKGCLVAKVNVCDLILGVAPPSFIFIHGGMTLQELSDSSGFLSFKSVFILALVAAISILPVVFKQKLQDKFKQT